MSSPWLANLRQHRTGVLIGGLLGLSGGPVGVIFGAGVGYWLDKKLREHLDPGSQLEVQRTFFEATFTVMGRLAKADGRVTEHEIAFAEEVMRRMNLTASLRQEAIALFNRGKSTEIELAEVLEPLERAFKHSLSLRLMFVEVQIQAALVDGQLSQPELEILQRVCVSLGIGLPEFQLMVRRVQAQQEFHRWQHQNGGQASSSQGGLQEAYGVLGVSAENTDAEVKKAYRRLMSQHHPDKLVAKGLPDEMLQLAKEKTQEIQAAYERVKSARGMV